MSDTCLKNSATPALPWRVPENGNSGVYLRVPDIETDTLPTWTGVEVQILDDEGPQYQGKLKDYQYSGSIYEFVPAGKRVYKGAGQWNRFEITCKGNLNHVPCPAVRTKIRTAARIALLTT